MSPRSRRLASATGLLLGASMSLAGCGAAMTADEQTMCEARNQLVYAWQELSRAQSADARNDSEEARTFAGYARDDAEVVHGRLLSISDKEIQAAPTWQALLDAYLHVGQGANAFLPGFEGTADPASELRMATTSLADATKALPASCGTPVAQPPASAD